MPKRSSTTKDISLLSQFYNDGQITLAPEFQRNNVWPSRAKAYLIDTILNDRPIPLFFLQRTTSPQTGRPAYSVIDGQQRLRAIFEFLSDRFRLSQSTKEAPYYNKRFSNLSNELQARIHNYDLVVEELSGYSDSIIQDMFVRMNKYVVKLSPQELRHAREKGRFHDFVERLGKLNFWKTHKVFSPLQLRRMRAVEFAAELTILLIEGPQDKKSTIDLYYGMYQDEFADGPVIEARLRPYLEWIEKSLPDLGKHRFRRPVDLYSLIGALDLVTSHGKTLSKLKPRAASGTLIGLEKETRQKHPTGDAARYVVASTSQTDNIGPRNTRIEILARTLRNR